MTLALSIRLVRKIVNDQGLQDIVGSRNRSRKRRRKHGGEGRRASAGSRRRRASTGIAKGKFRNLISSFSVCLWF
ncbi:hypothetical protein MA16_Dca018304 [Dendrobium catenatum]|uniref:Uncharacterized protein n=1 Tax=Dendrobium catenatum TaxID=906689 RepID=A0A2I0W1A9_9ASPA|nr:hypothetical protein MA16_Dca018304 [Dendrobium catenatum]